jgi:hypothetical protein
MTPIIIGIVYIDNSCEESWFGNFSRFLIFGGIVQTVDVMLLMIIVWVNWKKSAFIYPGGK